MLLAQGKRIIFLVEFFYKISKNASNFSLFFSINLFILYLKSVFYTLNNGGKIKGYF